MKTLPSFFSSSHQQESCQTFQVRSVEVWLEILMLKTVLSQNDLSRVALEQISANVRTTRKDFPVRRRIIHVHICSIYVKTPFWPKMNAQEVYNKNTSLFAFSQNDDSFLVKIPFPCSRKRIFQSRCWPTEKKTTYLKLWFAWTFLLLLWFCF